MGRSKQRKKATPPTPRPDLQRREIDAEVLHAHLERGRAAMGEEGYIELRTVVDTMAFLSKEVAAEGMTLDGLRHVLFGPRTEIDGGGLQEACGAQDRRARTIPRRRAMAAKVPRTTPALTG